MHDSDLVASTQGRSFWILDDLSALRQLNDTVASSPVHLFQPRDTYRMRVGGGGGGLGGNSAVGQNPASGVVVWSCLKEAPADGVTIEFLDRSGKIIRTIRSRDNTTGGAAERIAFAGPGPARPIISAAAGLNRFEWDMRYADAPPPPPGTILFGGSIRGVQAIPGAYQVRLTVGGKSFTQPFEIKKARAPRRRRQTSRSSSRC